MKHCNANRAQEKRILDYLCTGKPITPLMALRRFRAMRLGARIYQLRKKHRITTTMVKRGGARVAEYRLVH